MSYRKVKKTESLEKCVSMPECHTVLGTDSNVVCTRKRLNDNTTKYICSSKDAEELRYLLLHILDNCINQIHIICGGRSGCGAMAFFEDTLRDSSEISKLSIFEPVFNRDTAEPYNTAFRRIQVEKPYSDGEKLKEFLSEIKHELNESYSFKILKRVISDVKMKTQEAQYIIKESIVQENKMKMLRNAVATQGKDSKLEIHKFHQIYGASCDSVQKLLFYNLIKLRYIKAYENSRFEQNKIKCDRGLRELENIISTYKIKIENETRTNDEIVYYINDNKKDLGESIQIWQQKYNNDIEIYQLANLQIKDNLDEVKKINKDLKILFAEHKKAIKDFKEYKENKLKQEEEEQ